MIPDGETNAGLRSGLVVLVGWTNVGKSTLLNELVGTKIAAVADVSQTTRRRILGVRSVPGRGQAVFVDTPGIHRPRYKMNRRMVELARQSVEGVDLVLVIVDAMRGPGPGDAEVVQLVARAAVPAILVLNKIDRVRPKHKLLPMMQLAQEQWDIVDTVPVSALTGEGCAGLLDQIFARLPEGPLLYPEDYLTDQPERQLAAEWVREKLLGEMKQEIPHATAVTVDRWHEREDGVLEIDASILVDKDSQKKIVIGKDGAVLKRVGTAARQELEPLVGHRVFLTLWVRVSRDWRNDENVLRQLGLG